MRVNYRKLAFDHYEQLGQIVCAHCGFGIRDVLEVAHLDCDRSHNEVSNLAILCPTCHKMLDLDLITTATIIEMRDRPKIAVWAKRMKDAGVKAAAEPPQDSRETKMEECRRKGSGNPQEECREEQISMSADDTELGKFNAVLRKVLSVPREELLKREKTWKKKQARKKRAKISPASRASNDKG